MKLRIVRDEALRGDRRVVEIVERKGIGHPDTLADMMADQFSATYARHCLDRFGVIPNHWADKMTIAGGKADIDFGQAVVRKPITVHQFGRMTPDIGPHMIDIDGLLETAVDDVVLRVFGASEIRDNIRCHATIHDGAGPDHPKAFYDPQSVAELLGLSDTANDTSVVTAYSGYSQLEMLTVELENYVNSPAFKAGFPATGTDVKILSVREGDSVDITLCVPFIARLTPNHKFYLETLAAVRWDIITTVAHHHPDLNVTVHLNTKDRGEMAYLTVFGTAADKGDCGCVGRGNRYGGLITLGREMSIEAPSGKNPKSHAGRLYNEIAFRIARDIHLQFGVPNSITIVSRNGDELGQPAFIFVQPQDCELDPRAVEGIVHYHLGRITDLTLELVQSDPVDMHRTRPRLMYGAGWSADLNKLEPVWSGIRAIGRSG